MSKRIQRVILVLIIVIGVVLRMVFLNIAPPALNIDEAALGYNAYSILKTGRDEHGVFLPLALESFGDWKLPVYSYIAIIPISVFGLTEFSTRLPSIIAGVVGIALIYLISLKLFNNKNIALFSAFFFAVSPWSIYFSRAAYEVNLATTIFLGGLTLFLYGLNSKNKKLLLSVSGVLLGLTLFTYHSYIIFSVLFSGFLLIYYQKYLKICSLFFAVPFLIFIAFSSYSNFLGPSVKIETTTIFSDENILYERVNKFRKDNALNKFQFFDVIHTRYFGIPYQISQNYLNTFSPNFLFDKGGEKLIHNTVGFGNLYLIDIVFILLGIIGILKREKNKGLVFSWLLLAPIPSSITLDHPNSTRLFLLMPVFMLFSGYGAWMVTTYFLKQKISKVMLFIIGIFYALNMFYFLNLYFLHNSYHRAQFWRVGFKEIVTIANKNQDIPVVMQGVYDFPYIYFLFYNSYDPKQFWQEVEYYPRTNDGFLYVKKFNRFTFVHALAEVKEKPNVLYIDNQNFHKNDNFITLPNGDPIFKYYLKHD